MEAWEKFFAIQHAQPEDSNELFQKLLEDLLIINKKLAEYNNSPSWDRPTFFSDNEEHFVQYKEYLENSSKEINMKNTMLELLEVCRQKELYCMHNNVDDLIKSALNSKLLLINLNSQCLDKEKQEVKNIVEQPTKRRTRIIESLHNFRVIHKKSSISLHNTSQISPVHAIAPVLPTEEPEYSLSMGYEHLNTIPETESDEVIESSVEKLVPIPSEYEVTSEDKRECDVPVCENSPTFDDHSEILSDSNNDDISINDDAFEDIEYVEATPLDSELGIENFGYDLKGDIHFLEELLIDDSIPIPKNESSDHQDDPSFPRPPPEPPDVEFLFDLEPNSGEVTSEDKKECDVPVCENSPTFDDHSEILSDSNNDDISINDDAFEDIEYVEATPLDSELVSLEEKNDVHQEDEEFNLEDIFQIQDVVLREKLLSINRLIANIESLNDNPTPDLMLKSSSSFPIFEKSDNSLSISDNSLPEFETFSDHTKETRSGSTTAHANNSLFEPPKPPPAPLLHSRTTSLLSKNPLVSTLMKRT
nr:hypothetical protein [Tanacetum cinerariifolium]